MNFLLDDTKINIKISKDSEEMRALKLTWNEPYVVLDSKIFVLATLVNLALLNRETCAKNKNDLKPFVDFYHKSIRRILGTRMK